MARGGRAARGQPHVPALVGQPNSHDGAGSRKAICQRGQGWWRWMQEGLCLYAMGETKHAARCCAWLWTAAGQHHGLSTFRNSQKNTVPQKSKKIMRNESKAEMLKALFPLSFH